MISEMSLMRALVIKSESDKILDALSKTGATQIKKCGEYELASPAEAKSDQSVADLTAKARAALKFIDFAHEQLAARRKGRFRRGYRRVFSRKNRSG